MSDQRLRTQTQTLSSSPATQPRFGPRRPVMIVVQGTELGRRYALHDRRVVLGREGSGVDWVIDDPSVSGRHARVESDRDGECYLIVDLGSRNGTYVNGSPVGTHCLVEGDKIWLGSTVLKFTFHDTIEEQFHGELDRLMHLDSLTGLYRRRWFDVEYPKAFARAYASGDRLCVVMMDMDGLKQVNDSLGHRMGSHCISETGKLIKSCLPPGAAGARFGGDEFVAWVPDVDLEDVIEIAEQIRERVETCEFRLSHGIARPTISIGIASLGTSVSTPEDLLQLADDALYRAKKRGRNTVCV